MFYKYENDNLMEGPCVFGAEYVLVSEEKDQYQFPVDGWYWFDAETEAYTFFGIPAKTV